MRRIGLLMVIVLLVLVSCDSGTGPVVEVRVEPATAEVLTLGTHQFTAVVTGSANTAVAWSASCGSVAVEGQSVLFTAPAEAATCEVRAQSAADATKSGVADVTVVEDPGPVLSYLTPRQAADEIEAIGNDFVSIGNGLLNGVLGNALAGVAYGSTDGPVLSYPPLALGILQTDDWGAPPRLAAGTFTFDPDVDMWRYAAEPADRLILRWTARTDSTLEPEMELDVHWIATVPVDDFVGNTYQLPTSARIVLKQDGTEITNMMIAQTLRTTTCGRVAEAASFRIDGTAGNAAAGVTVEDLAFELRADDTATLKGDILARSGSLAVGLGLDLRAHLGLERDPQTCQPSLTGFDGGVATVRLDRPMKDVEVSFTAGAWQESSATVTLSAGRVVIGTGRFDFGGVVSFGEDDSVPQLTFANDETMPITDFVQNYLEGLW